MRSWNHVELIGHLTHNPELRMTPRGTAVCGFSVATNRARVDEQGARIEDTSYHRIIAWGPLAEQCDKLLKKGRFVFVSGRLAYRSYTTKDAEKRAVTEIVIEEMLLLDKRDSAGAAAARPATRTAEGIYAGVEPPEDLAF